MLVFLKAQTIPNYLIQKVSPGHASGFFRHDGNVISVPNHDLKKREHHVFQEGLFVVRCLDNCELWEKSWEVIWYNSQFLQGLLSSCGRGLESSLTVNKISTAICNFLIYCKQHFEDRKVNPFNNVKTTSCFPLFSIYFAKKMLELLLLLCSS